MNITSEKKIFYICNICNEVWKRFEDTDAEICIGNRDNSTKYRWTCKGCGQIYERPVGDIIEVKP